MKTMERRERQEEAKAPNLPELSCLVLEGLQSSGVKGVCFSLCESGTTPQYELFHKRISHLLEKNNQ